MVLDFSAINLSPSLNLLPAQSLSVWSIHSISSLSPSKSPYLPLPKNCPVISQLHHSSFCVYLCVSHMSPSQLPPDSKPTVALVAVAHLLWPSVTGSDSTVNNTHKVSSTYFKECWIFFKWRLILSTMYSLRSNLISHSFISEFSAAIYLVRHMVVLKSDSHTNPQPQHNTK